MTASHLYTDQYYEALREGSRRSAREIVPLVLELIQPKSVVDVGCGLGTWLSVFKEFGVTDYLGVDGDYVEEHMLAIRPKEFVRFNLESPFEIDRSFDLVVSLEVAEHLSPECAEVFVESLTRLGPVVLFSAAIPFQGGTGHVNEQLPDYWVQRFQRNNYTVIDCLRNRLWNNENVDPWYAQNILLFVRNDCIESYTLLARERKNVYASQLAVVHPKIYWEHLTDRVEEMRPWTFGAVYAIRVEVTEPLPDILPPPAAERARSIIELEGDRIGTVDLPVCDGLVPGHVLSDAIAAEFAWPILGRFFERTVYPTLTMERSPVGVSIWRGAIRLAEALPEDEGLFWSQVHDRIGWTVFLQELWALPNWPSARFYDPEAVRGPAGRLRADDGWVAIEVSRDLPDVETIGPDLDVVLMVGGVALGIVPIPSREKIVSAHSLRVALTSAGGFELCRVAVREGLLGKPLAGGISLRARLASAAMAASHQRGDGRLPETPAHIVLAPWATRTIERALAPGKRGVVLGRHALGAIGTSASRRAVLPAAAVDELVEAAEVSGEPVIQISRPDELQDRIVYAPDLIWWRRESVNDRRRLIRDTSLAAKTVANALVSVLRGRLLGEGGTPRSRVGSSQSNSMTPEIATDRLPILLYRHVAPGNSLATTRSHVTLEAFEKQLRYLHDAGFYSIRLEDWHTAVKAKRPLSGRAVLITFDTTSRNFLQYARPLLRQYAFSAVVFLAAKDLARSPGWNQAEAGEGPCPRWNELRQCRTEGVEFGWRWASHRLPTALPLSEIVREAARSRAILERELRTPVRAVAYPGDSLDRAVQLLIGACGYIFGLTNRSRLSTFEDSLLALPRIEVDGSSSLPEFVRKLGSQSPGSLAGQKTP